MMLASSERLVCDVRKRRLQFLSNSHSATGRIIPSLKLTFTGSTQNLGQLLNSKVLMGIFSQTTGSTCEFWVQPVGSIFHHGRCFPPVLARHRGTSSAWCPSTHKLLSHKHPRDNLVYCKKENHCN
jgi:hypothetical protein